jgi:hypothetical protein
LKEWTFMTPGYPSGAPALKEIAASRMVTHMPRATAKPLANTVIESLCGQKFECADTVFVTDAEGYIKLNALRLLRARKRGGK